LALSLHAALPILLRAGAGGVPRALHHLGGVRRRGRGPFRLARRLNAGGSRARRARPREGPSAHHPRPRPEPDAGANAARRGAERPPHDRAVTRDALLTALLDAGPHPLAEPLRAWRSSSRRFTAFLQAHASKVRKKLRTTTDPEGVQDLRLELETAYLLLRERALSVEFEPLKAGGGRSPDFAVTFTTSVTFLLEATRLQAARRRPWHQPRHRPGGHPPAGRALGRRARR